jgi:hypothetical protein
MTPAAVERNVSDFLRKSGDVLRAVEEHDVLLRRRAGAGPAAGPRRSRGGSRDTVGLSSDLLSRFARSHAQAPVEVLPWLRFLPAEDRRRFSEQFVPTLEACISLGSFDRLGELLHRWRNTACVWSRPELHDALRADHADAQYDEPVPAPVP